MVGLLVLGVLQLVIGAGVLAAVRPATPWEVVRTPGLALVTGLAYSGLAGSLFLESGLAFDRREFLLAGCVPCAAAVARGMLRGGGRARPTPPVSGGRPHQRWMAVLAVSVAAVALVRSVWQPLSSWDAWAVWTPKAESVLYFHGLSSAYLHSGVPNADYPPLVPALESLAFRFIGSMDTIRVHLLFALILVGFVAALTEALERRQATIARGAKLVVVLAAAPTLQFQTLTAYADVPLAVFTTMAALSLWRAVEGQSRGEWALATLFLAAAASTKIEGALFAVAVVVAMLLAVPAHRGRVRLRIVGVGVVAGVLSVVPWHVWLRLHDIRGGYTFHASYLLGQPLRAPRALAALLANTVDPLWLLLPVLAGIAIVQGLRSPATRRIAVFAGSATVLCLLLLTFAYWGTSYPFAWQLRTSADRVVTTPLLLAIALAALMVDSTEPLPPFRPKLARLRPTPVRPGGA